MSHLPKRLTVTLAIVIVMMLGPSLAGCSVQNLVHDVTGGKVDAPGKAVPKDFPSEVPLASGEVLSGVGVGDAKSKIWNVTIRANGEKAIDVVLGTLAAAGFDCKTLTATTADGGALACDKGTLKAAVVEIKDDKGYVLNYTVTDAASK